MEKTTKQWLNKSKHDSKCHKGMQKWSSWDVNNFIKMQKDDIMTSLMDNPNFKTVETVGMLCKV